MKRWIAIGFLTAFVMVLAFSSTLTAPTDAISQCCTMYNRPCPMGGYEIGSWDNKFCGHWGTVCDAYCNIP